MIGRVLGVAGVGLIGGSIALRARRAGATVVGFDRDPQVLRAAAAAGALDACAPDLGTLVARAETVVLALPIDATIAALAATPGLAGPALVFDVASVKTAVVAAGRHLPRFVASHPLAGREVGGFAAADAELFEGRTWAFVPAADAAATGAFEALICLLGGRPVAVEAAVHDGLVAVSSHLPQVLSVALGARLSEVAECDERVWALCGPGMESMLRLARSPADLWAAIAAANAVPLANELRGLAEDLEALAVGLEAGDAAPLRAAFAGAHGAVRDLERPLAADRRLLLPRSHEVTP